MVRHRHQIAIRWTVGTTSGSCETFRLHEGSRMIRAISLSSKCALVALTLQCLGCAADATGTVTAEPGAAVSVVDVAERGESSTSSDDSTSASVSVVRYSPASDPAASDSRTSPYLVTESAFIKHGAVSSETTDPLLDSKEMFTSAFERMSADEKKSMEAQDLAKHYRDALERAVGSQGVVEDLTCGLSLCMGLVSAISRADHDAWDERLLQDSTAARHVILQAIEMNGDRLQNRFLFSTDSAIKGIALPPKRGGESTRYFD